MDNQFLALGLRGEGFSFFVLLCAFLWPLSIHAQTNIQNTTYGPGQNVTVSDGTITVSNNVTVSASATVTLSHNVITTVNPGVHIYPGSNVHIQLNDTTPPTAPGNLASSAVTTSGLTLTWTASTDNLWVAGYKVYRNGTLIATLSPTTLSYTDSGLTDFTTYNYIVVAFDAAGNVSANSTLTVTTLIALYVFTPLP